MADLMNTAGAVPEPLYVFVNEEDPIAYHNFHVTGHFFSAAFANLQLADFVPKYLQGSVKYLPFAPCPRDLQVISPYQLTAINDYRVEYDAELHRSSHYPTYPSRLSAVFAFGDHESCEAASDQYGWKMDSLRKFTLVPNPLNRVIKVNMEHVSLARLAYRTSMMQDVGTLWESYWTGFGDISVELPTAGFQRKEFESGVIWEYLIEGGLKHVK